MEKFTIEENGLIRDEAILETIGSLKRSFPWMDAMTTEAYLAFIKAHGTVFNLLTPELAEAGLSPTRFNALRFLYVAEGRRLTMGEVRARLGVSTPLVTKIIDSLVKEEWVVRVPNTGDKRIVYAQLTDNGVARFEERFPVLHERMTGNWAGLNDQEKLLLVHLLNKLRLGVLGRYAQQILQLDSNEETEVELR
jgi:DNA-binding MarR family transcriptional regulator